MKKILIKLVAMVLMMSFLGVPTSFASEEISVKINGETLIFDVPPQIVDGRTMVPMRTIFEALGASIEWYGETKTIIAKKADKTIKTTIGEKEISINEKITEMDVAPVIINSRTLVPARFVAEALGAEVAWDGDTKTVLITLVEESEEFAYDASKYSKVECNSEKGNMSIYNAFDGKESTFWHSNYKARESEVIEKDKCPHVITVTFVTELEISAVSYLPRQDNTSGAWKKAEIHTSTDGETFKKL